MLAVVEENRLTFLVGRKIFVRVVAVVEKMKSNLVEQQRRRED
jgi:hypothetical protein